MLYRGIILKNVAIVQWWNGAILLSECFLFVYCASYILLRCKSLESEDVKLFGKSIFLASRTQDCTALDERTKMGEDLALLVHTWRFVSTHTDNFSDFPWFQSHLNPQGNMMPCGEKKVLMSKKILALKSSPSPALPLTGLSSMSGGK